MNVNSTHFECDARRAGWSQARDLIASEDVVKAVAEKYSPRLDFQTDDDSTACGLSPSFCNAAARTVEGHPGMTSRHAPFQRLSKLRKTGEGADAMKLGLTGETGTSAKLATRVNGSPPQVLRWVRWWNSTERIPDHVTERQVLVELNLGSNVKRMEALELTGVVNSWMAGAISQDTCLFCCPMVKFSPAGRGSEEEKPLLPRTPTPVPMKVQPTPITP